MLKDVHSLPLVFSKEWVTVRKCYAKRQSDPKDVFVYVWEVEGGGGDNVLYAVNCAYVCLILQYSQDHTILNPCFDA